MDSRALDKARAEPIASPSGFRCVASKNTFSFLKTDTISLGIFIPVFNLFQKLVDLVTIFYRGVKAEFNSGDELHAESF